MEQVAVVANERTRTLTAPSEVILSGWLTALTRRERLLRSPICFHRTKCMVGRCAASQMVSCAGSRPEDTGTMAADREAPRCRSWPGQDPDRPAVDLSIDGPRFARPFALFRLAIVCSYLSGFMAMPRALMRSADRRPITLASSEAR